MKIHEYQAKELFRRYDIAVPESVLITKSEDADKAVEKLGLPVVVKAQILAGGRGKGGGVRVAKTKGEALVAVADILGMTLVTKQTGSNGTKVRKVLLEQGVEIDSELYLAILVDRAKADILIVLSREGGMDIEEVAEKSPERIISIPVDPLGGIQGYHLREAGFAFGLGAESRKLLALLLKKLFQLFVECDCSLLEINPLVITSDGTIIPLDAKIDVDGCALYRHPDINAFHDTAEEDPLEVEAAAIGLNYIRLQGNVGNMVNGAGLAMATMDLIKQAGAEPANFLDVGGGASAEMVEKGFRIILADPHVQAVFINIFGGILRCDVLASGVVQAARAVGVTIPVLVRMEGTNVDKGRKILADSGLDLVTVDNLSSAAETLADMVN